MSFSGLLDGLYGALTADLTIWGHTFNMLSVWVFSAVAGLVVWFINSFRGGGSGA